MRGSDRGEGVVIVAIIAAVEVGVAVVVVDGVVNRACQPLGGVVRMNKGIVFGRDMAEGKSYMNGRKEW